MAIGFTNDTYYHEISEAIRTRSGASKTYKPNEMASAIRDIGKDSIAYADNWYDVPYTEVMRIQSQHSIGNFSFLYRDSVHMKELHVLPPQSGINVGFAEGFCMGCTSLETVEWKANGNMPSVTFRGCVNLKTVTLGGIGYPVTSGNATTFKECDKSDLVIIIYVRDDATLPLANSPFGAANARIEYRSCTTGEVIPV